MKSNTMIGFLALLLVVVYLLVTKIELDEFDDMARFIPDTALIYLEQHNAIENLNQFARSPFGQAVQRIDFQSTGAKIGLGQSLLSTIEEVGQFYGEAKENKLIRELFGKRFSISILAPINTDKKFKPEILLEQNTVLISEPFHSAKVLEFMFETYFEYKGEGLITTAQYGNHQIKRVMLEGRTISFVVIDGLFIFCVNERQLRRCIDTFDQELLSLQKNSAFVRIRKATQKANRVIYYHLDNLRDFIGHYLREIEFGGRNLIEKELANTTGFTGLGLATWNSKDTIVNKIISTFNPEKINLAVQKHLQVAPDYNSMFTLTSSKPMLYYWSNTFDFNNLLDYYEEQYCVEGNRPDSFLPEIEKVSGKSAREIVSYLGEQVSFIAEPAMKESFFELPLGLAVWQLKNGPDLQKVIEKIVKNYGISMSNNQYGSVVYYYWAQSPQDGIYPLYGFSKDYFFLGNSLSLFKKVIDNHGKSLSLIDLEEVQKVDPGFSDTNNSITYLNNKELLGVIKKSLDMISTLVGIEDKQIARKFKIIVKDVVNPLLDGARMYESTGTRSYFDTDTVVIESKTSLATEITTGKEI